MLTIYVYGDSGTGKTTWAIAFAESHKYSYYISSGSNDVLDDYEGQDCIILDDLRPSCLGLSDLLKMLDPNTSSTVKSRYYNKVLECKVIIITTTLPMETFFHQVFENEKEPLKQLERRCQRVLRLTHDTMFFKAYDRKLGRYVHSDPFPNTILASMNIESLTEDDVNKMESDMFMASQSEIKKMRKANTSESHKAADFLEDAMKKCGINGPVSKDEVPF